MTQSKVNLADRHSVLSERVQVSVVEKNCVSRNEKEKYQHVNQIERPQLFLTSETAIFSHLIMEEIKTESSE